MSVGPVPMSWPGASQAPSNVSSRVRWVGAGALLLSVFAVGLAKALANTAISPALALSGGVLLVVAFALVIARFELAVTTGFLLFAVVLVEPAPSDVLFGLIILVALVTGRFDVRRPPRTALIVVLGFLAVNLLSAASVLDWGVAARFFGITVYLGVFALWLSTYMDRPSRARRLVRAYLAAAVFSAVLASLSLFVHYPLASVMIGDGSRAKGLFKDPNVYGPFLVPITLIVAEEMLRAQLLRLRRPVMLACFLALVIGVVFSYSRAAWLNLAVGMVVLIALVALRRPDRKALSLVVVALVSAAAIVGAVVGTGSLGFLEQRAHLQTYDSQRFAAQAHGLSTGLTHPFGVGPGQFEVIYPVATHSLYIRSFSEQGIIGLLLIIVLVVGTMAMALVNVLRGRDTYGISAAALLAAWCGLVANSFFVDTLHWRHLWLVAALIWAAALRGREAFDWRVPTAALSAKTARRVGVP